jgi:hypothetical protein
MVSKGADAEVHFSGGHVDGQMVRATGRRTSRLCRYGCRDGATAAQFWSLSDKIIVSSHPPILLVAKSGAHPFYGFDRR